MHPIEEMKREISVMLACDEDEETLLNWYIEKDCPDIPFWIESTLDSKSPQIDIDALRKWGEMPATQSELAEQNARDVDSILKGAAETRRAQWHKSIDFERTKSVAEEIGLDFTSFILDEFECRNCLARDRDKQFILATCFTIDMWENSEDPKYLEKLASLSETATKWYVDVHGVCCKNYRADYQNGPHGYDEVVAIYPEIKVYFLN